MQALAQLVEHTAASNAPKANLSFHHVVDPQSHAVAYTDRVWLLPCCVFAQVPSSMSRTHVYAVATITPKALSRLLTLNLLPR